MVTVHRVLLPQLLAAWLYPLFSNANILHPHVPYHINNAELRHLQPADHSELWYKEKVLLSTEQAVHAKILYNFTYPAVVLDHSMHTTETCTETTMMVQFHSDDAFEYAVDNWSSYAHMILLTSRKSCTRFYTQQLRAMFLSNNLSFNSTTRTALATGTFKTVQDVATHGDAKWGAIVQNPNYFSDLRATHEASQAAERAAQISPLSTSTVYVSASSCTQRYVTINADNSTSATAAGSRSSSTASTSSANSGTSLSTIFTSSSHPSSSVILSSSGGASATSPSNDTSSGVSSSPSTTSITTSSNTANPTGNPYTSVQIVSGAMYAPSWVSSNPCDPPAATISGLPATSYCDDEFDHNLDASRGYFNLDTASNVGQILAIIAPGVFNNPEDYSNDLDYNVDSDSTSSKRDLYMLLEKRGFSIKNAFHAVAATIAKKVESAAKTVVAKVEAVAKTAVSAAGEVVKTVIKDTIGHVFSPSVTLPLKAKYALPQRESSPWGNQFLLYQYIPKKALTGENAARQKSSLKRVLEEGAQAILPDQAAYNAGASILKNIMKREEDVESGEKDVALLKREQYAKSEKEISLEIDLYCVNCGFDINFQSTGHISFSLLKGIIDGGVAISGGMHALLQVGLVGNYSYKVELLHKRLATVGIPELTIPNELVVGPFLTVDVGAFLEVSVEGTLLAGLEMSMPNSYAYADFKDKSKNIQSGWKPTFKETLQAYAEIGATLGFETPIGLAFGIDIGNGKEDIDIAIIDTPIIQAHASISAKWEMEAVQNLTTGVTTYVSTPIGDIWNAGQCPGIQWEIDFVDELSVEIPKVYTFQLWTTTITLKTGCITLWHSPTPTPTPSTTTTYSVTVTPKSTSKSSSSSASSTKTSSSPSITSTSTSTTSPASSSPSTTSTVTSISASSSSSHSVTPTSTNASSSASNGLSTAPTLTSTSTSSSSSPSTTSTSTSISVGTSTSSTPSTSPTTSAIFTTDTSSPTSGSFMTTSTSASISATSSPSSTDTSSPNSTDTSPASSSGSMVTSSTDTSSPSSSSSTISSNTDTSLPSRSSSTTTSITDTSSSSTSSSTVMSSTDTSSPSSSSSTMTSSFSTSLLSSSSSTTTSASVSTSASSLSTSLQPGPTYVASDLTSLFTEYLNRDFPANDLFAAGCTPGQDQLIAFGTTYTCQSQNDCMNICASITNIAGSYACAGISYTPNGNGGNPTPYCYIKSAMPQSIARIQPYVVNSAVLFDLFAPSIWTAPDSSKFWEYFDDDLWFSTEVDNHQGPCCTDTTRCNGFEAFGTTYQCQDFYQCQSICSAINTQTGNSTCVGVSYTPEGSPPYCWIKTQTIATPKTWSFRVASARYLVQEQTPNTATNYPVNGSSYLASNGQSVFWELSDGDFGGDDLQWATCTPGSTFATSYGSWPCENFWDCQNVCGNVNVAAGSAVCLAVSYTPNGDPALADPTCFLKNAVPNWTTASYVVNSAQLISPL